MADKIPASQIDFSQLTPEQIIDLAAKLLHHLEHDSNSRRTLAEIVDKHNKSRGGRRD